MIKLFFLTLAALSCSVSSIFSDKAKTTVGFELVNRSNQPIWATVLNSEPTTTPGESVVIEDPKEVAPAGAKNSTFQQKIDLSRTTKLAIWLNDPRDTIIYKKASLQDKNIGRPDSYFVPTPHVVYSFPVNKTIYLSWDKLNAIRPQKGPLKGVLKRTESNLSLENNINEAEIRSAIQKVA